MPATLNLSKVKQSYLIRPKSFTILPRRKLLAQIPEPEKYIDEVDDVFDYLFEQGIDVFDKVESKEALEYRKRKK